MPDARAKGRDIPCGEKVRSKQGSQDEELRKAMGSAGKIVATGIVWGTIILSEVEINAQESFALGKIALVSASPKRF
jgi:hypothetical protein